MRRAGWVAGLLLAFATAAAAQTAVRVTRDGTAIYAADYQSTLVSVNAGTVLIVAGRRGDWYEVALPGADPASASRGFVFKSNVDAVPFAGATAAPRHPAEAGGTSGKGRAIEVMGYGQFAYTRFTANDSVSAILGQPGGSLFGGGAQVRFHAGLFVDASIEHFEQTGQRVFVFNGEVFRLGTPDTISLTPITLTAGWRFVNRLVTPYGGAGVGRTSYSETSSVADPSENVSSHFTSYHALGGVEFRQGWVATAFEVQFSRAPDAAGRGGASAAFNESDLGGLTARVKVMVGH